MFRHIAHRNICNSPRYWTGCFLKTTRLLSPIKSDQLKERYTILHDNICVFALMQTFPILISSDQSTFSNKFAGVSVMLFDLFNIWGFYTTDSFILRWNYTQMDFNNLLVLFLILFEGIILLPLFVHRSVTHNSTKSNWSLQLWQS